MPPERILIVEDEALLAADTREQLLGWGYDVPGIATSGEQAVDLVATERPDLVLMDVRIKGEMDGISVAALLRASFSVPVVYTSASSDEELLCRAEATEPLGYLVKPIPPQALLATVRLALYKVRRDRERARLEDQIDDIIEDLQATTGAVTMCASCRAIRDREGNWLHTRKVPTDGDVMFSHGLCPDCVRALYPDAPLAELHATVGEDASALGLLRSLNTIRELLATPAWEARVGAALGVLGKLTATDRAYLFAYHAKPDGSGDVVASQRFEWCRAGIEPQIDNPELGELDLALPGFRSAFDCHRRGEPHVCLVKDVEQPFRAHLEAQGTLSLIDLPVFSPRGLLLGFIGFESCTEERPWSTGEILALSCVAAILGSQPFPPETYGVSVGGRFASLCRYCQQLQGSDGVFQSVEDYLAREHDVRTTDCICPACTRAVLAERS